MALRPAIILGLLLTGPPASASLPERTDARPEALPDTVYLAQAIRSAGEKAMAKDCPGSRDILAGVIDNPAFAKLSGPVRHSTYSLLATCESYDAGSKGLDEHIRIASEMPEADAQDWVLRAATAMAHGHADEAVQAIETLSARWPDAIGRLDDDHVIDLVRYSLTRQDPALALKLLRALFAGSWHPSLRSGRFDWIWRMLATLELEAGQSEKAERVMRTIIDPSELIILAADRRFDALTAKDPEAFAPLRHAEAFVQERRDISAANPKSLVAQNRLVHALSTVGRTQEALAVVEKVVAAALPPDGSKSTYADPDQVNWTLELRAVLLARLGRFDDAIAGSRRAARFPEFGQINVTQTLYLAGLLMFTGQLEESRRVAARLAPRDMSTFGQVNFHSVQVCTAAQLGDQDRVRTGLADLDRLVDETSFRPYARALLCADQGEKLAQFLRDQLGRTKSRQAALEAMQTYEASFIDTPFARRLRERWIGMLENADLRAELAETGRTANWPLATADF